MSYVDKKLTVDDNKYLVIEQVDLDNHTYLYLANSNDENDSMFVEIENESIKTIDPTLFQEKVLPLFLEKFNK